MMKLNFPHACLVILITALPGTVQAQAVVLGVTSIQAVLQYPSPGATACQVQVSPNSSMSPLAADVDPALFPGANLDSRAGNVSSPTGNNRYFVVGKRRADLAADGNHYSRALQAFTEYFFQINCGGSPLTGRFVTTNPPLGNNFPEPPPFDATGFGNYAWPTINWADQTKGYIDPMTGILLKRATAPGWYGLSKTGANFSFALDLNSAWTNASNILSGATSSLAGYSGSGGDPLFVSFGQLTGFGGNGFGSWYPNQTLDNIMVRVFGTGAGTVSGCLSDDSGAHCVSPAVDIVTLGGSGGNPAGTFPVACTSESATGCFPNNGFWGGWNFTPVNGQIGTSSGTLNTAGSAVTAGPSSEFGLNWKAGGKIFIAGSSPGCAGNLCTIVSVNSSSSMTIQENAGTLNGASFTTVNRGIVLWMKKGSGTTHASISVNFDYAYSDMFTMPLNGTVAQCSPNPTTVSYAADGVTHITPVSGQLCLASHPDGPQQVLYLLIPSTGETRLLSPIYLMNASDPGSDQVADPVVSNIHMLGAAFDSTDPNTIYAQVGTNGGSTLFKGIYNAAVYKFKSYAHSLYPSASGGFNPGQDTTQYWYRGPAWSDTGLNWTNLTKASQGNDLGAQIAQNDSNFAANLFHAPTVTQVNKGRAYAVNYPMSNGASESTVLIHSFNLSTGQLAQTANTWQTFPNRWCAMHSNVEIEGWYGLICNPLGGAFGFSSNPGIMGVGPWQLTPTAMFKNGAFSSDTSMTPTAPLDSCPAIPAFLVGLMPPNPHCITFQSRMACSLTPYPGENTKWPCEYNPSYSELQPLAPGDEIIALNGTQQPESEMILTVTPLGSANYQFTAVRYGLAGPGVGALTSAPTGWTGYAMPPGTTCNYGPVCTPGVGMWFDGTASSVTWLLDPGAFAGHSDLGNGPTPGANSYCLTNACRYNKPMAQQIGSFGNVNGNQLGSFAGVPGSIGLEGYPSVHQLTAPPSEQQWMLNFRHMNPNFGSGPEVPSDVGSVAYTLVSGTQGVFKFTSVSGGVNYKSVPLIAYAGYHLLQDVSSPLTGNVITDSTAWQFCVVWKAGECRTGSNAGEVYASVPSGSVRQSQNCVSNWYDDNYPCVFTPPASAAFGIQQDISRNDPNGNYWRRITMGLSGPGRQFQFASFIPDPTGAWAFMEGFWPDGARNDLLIAKLPPWPNPKDVTTNRSNFIQQSVTVAASANLPGARIRFGYGENGPPASFFCTARQEACVTGGAPYSFQSENPQWQSCAGGCTIQVPAIPGRVLFYAVDRQDGNGNTVPGQTQVQVVP
jgi:hypothetical protein